jgi:OOP family OmpA-OmpF porin
MKKLMVLLVMVIAAAAPASALDRGFYLGAGFGFSSFDVGDFYDDYRPLRFEEGNPGFKVFGGYRIFNFLAVEVGYLDYGNITKREGLRGFNERLSVGIDQWDASVLGVIPLGHKAGLFGKVGAASWDADVLYTADGVPLDLSSSGTDLTYGLGVDFVFKKVGIRVEGDWLDIPDTGGAFMASFNLTYNF